MIKLDNRSLSKNPHQQPRVLGFICPANVSLCSAAFPAPKMWPTSSLNVSIALPQVANSLAARNVAAPMISCDLCLSQSIIPNSTGDAVSRKIWPITKTQVNPTYLNTPVPKSACKNSSSSRGGTSSSNTNSIYAVIVYRCTNPPHAFPETK